MRLGDSDPELLEVFLSALDERRAPPPQPAQPTRKRVEPRRVTTPAASFAAALNAAVRR